MENPFLLFPEEVWDIILGMMEDSQDILNMIQALPELDVVLEKKRHLWLFEQVIPHVAPWLKPKVILACRGVCRRWSRAMDNFLENHPSLRARDPEHPVTGQLWHPKASSRHYDLDELKIYPIRFETTESVTKFLEDMEDHPPERNPFVGRSVQLSPDYEYRRRSPPPAAYLQFWIEVLHLIDRFGKHIWFLDMGTSYAATIHFARTLLDSLDGLPNLKGLLLSELNYDFDNGTCHISDDDDEEEEDEPTPLVPEDIDAFLDSRKDALPHLSQLESLNIIIGTPNKCANLLISRYSLQIRNLHLQPPSHLWKEEYANLFPNLTGFTANDIVSPEAVPRLLETLNSPKLSYLDLNLGWDGSRPFIIDKELLAGLKRFPALEHLALWSEEELGNGSIEESGSLDSAVDSITSLKSLTINANNQRLNYKFLLCVPSLEYLQIGMGSQAKIRFRRTPDAQSRLKIREYIQNMKLYDSNVWELLPKLKQVNLLLYLYPRNKHFSRAGYDYNHKS